MSEEKALIEQADARKTRARVRLERKAGKKSKAEEEEPTN